MGSQRSKSVDEIPNCNVKLNLKNSKFTFYRKKSNNVQKRIRANNMRQKVMAKEGYVLN